MFWCMSWLSASDDMASVLRALGRGIAKADKDPIMLGPRPPGRMSTHPWMKRVNPVVRHLQCVHHYQKMLSLLVGENRQKR